MSKFIKSTKKDKTMFSTHYSDGSKRSLSDMEYYGAKKEKPSKHKFEAAPKKKQRKGRGAKLAKSIRIAQAKWKWR